MATRGRSPGRQISRVDGNPLNTSPKAKDAAEAPKKQQQSDKTEVSEECIAKIAERVAGWWQQTQAPAAATLNWYEWFELTVCNHGLLTCVIMLLCGVLANFGVLWANIIATFWSLAAFCNLLTCMGFVGCLIGSVFFAAMVRKKLFPRSSNATRVGLMLASGTLLALYCLAFLSSHGSELQTQWILHKDKFNQWLLKVKYFNVFNLSVEFPFWCRQHAWFC